MGWNAGSMPVFDYRAMVNVKPVIRFVAYRDNFACSSHVSMIEVAFHQHCDGTAALGKQN